MRLKISRILHAGYIFEHGDMRIAFDPIFENPFSRNCYAFPPVEFDLAKIRDLKFDAVFISHFHDDHCSFESLDLLDRRTPLYVFCVFDELFEMLRQLGFTQVYSLLIDEAVFVGTFEIIPRLAVDADVDSLFHIKVAGLNILNVVDSWIDPSAMNQLVGDAINSETSTTWDMVLWPFQTMRELEVLAPSQVRASFDEPEWPVEWTLQLRRLNPRYVVPSSCQFLQESWSWYNHAFFPISYRGFAQQIKHILPSAQVVRMNPSVSFFLDKNSLEAASALEWILPIGEQDVDYEFKPHCPIPTTAEIAQHFFEATAGQRERVYEYCRRDLLEKYRSLEEPLDECFLEPFFWQLTIYDHIGLATEFFYQVCGRCIEIVDPSTGSGLSVGWTTEIPLIKIYAALEWGEALTSLYMRINPIQGADIVEDPLIRCLYSREFGAYQAAQLKKLNQHATPARLSPKRENI